MIMMTIEEKAAAYDAVLERAKKQKADYEEAFDELDDKTSVFAQILKAGIFAIDGVVPEIKETDKKTIRKKLCEFFNSALGKDTLQRKCGLNPDEVLAYLEEDEGHELAEKSSELDKDERVRRELIKLVNDTCKYEALRDEFIGYLERVKKEKEVESAVPYIDFVIKPHEGDDNNPYDMRVPEAHEYAIKRGFDVPFNYGEVYVDERHLTQTIGNILRWADEHPKEQQTEQLTEDDKTKLKNALSGLKYAYEDLKNNKSLTSASLISEAFNWLRQYFNFDETEIYY